MKELYEEVKKSETYNKNVPEGSILSHIFVMLPQGFNPETNSVFDYEIQVGFYHKESHTVSIIKSLHNNFSFEKGDTPYTRPEDTKIEAINLDDLKISIKDAFKTLGELIKEKYQGNIPMKTIVVLQKLSEGFVWNLTILRSDFKTLNAKIDAVTGEIVDHSCTSLISIDK